MGNVCCPQALAGVFCLMSVVALSNGLRQLMCAPRGMCFACQAFLSIACFFFFFFLQVFGFSDTDEVKEKRIIIIALNLA